MCEGVLPERRGVEVKERGYMGGEWVKQPEVAKGIRNLASARGPEQKIVEIAAWIRRGFVLICCSRDLVQIQNLHQVAVEYSMAFRLPSLARRVECLASEPECLCSDLLPMRVGRLPTHPCLLVYTLLSARGALLGPGPLFCPVRAR